MHGDDFMLLLLLLPAIVSSAGRYHLITDDDDDDMNPPPPPSLGRDVFAVFDRSADDAYSAAWANSDCKSIIDPLIIRLANYERKNERTNERVGVKLRSHHLGMHLQRNG